MKFSQLFLMKMWHFEYSLSLSLIRLFTFTFRQTKTYTQIKLLDDVVVVYIDDVTITNKAVAIATKSRLVKCESFYFETLARYLERELKWRKGEMMPMKWIDRLSFFIDCPPVRVACMSARPCARDFVPLLVCLLGIGMYNPDEDDNRINWK